MLLNLVHFKVCQGWTYFFIFVDAVFWWQIEKRYCLPFKCFLRNFPILKTFFVPVNSFFVARMLVVLLIWVTHLYWIQRGYRRRICCNFHFPPKLYWSYSTLHYVAILPIEKLPFLFHATYLGVDYLSTFTFIVYLGLRWLLHSTIGHTNALCIKANWQFLLVIDLMQG